MASCYICGTYIEPNAGYRRRVNTGNSFGMSYGRRIIPSTRTYYGDRTLCQSCAKAHDRWQIVKLVVILFAILAFFIFKGNDNSSSNTTGYTSLSVSDNNIQPSTSQAKQISSQRSQEKNTKSISSADRIMRIKAPDELNVRSGPGTTFKVVNKLRSGDIVAVQRTENGWSYIGIGWVRTKFLITDQYNDRP